EFSRVLFRSYFPGPNSLKTKMAEFFGNLAITGIDPDPVDRIFIHHLSKMNNIKVFALLVNEGAEPHIFVILCSIEPSVYQYAIQYDFLIKIIWHLLCSRIT